MRHIPRRLRIVSLITVIGCLLLFGFFSSNTVSADSTASLLPIADGGTESSQWLNNAGFTCSSTSCYTAIDEISGINCSATANGDTDYIVSGTSAGAIQTFDLDESTISDGAIVTSIDIKLCDRFGGASAGSYQPRHCHSGICTAGPSSITPGSTYAEHLQTIDFIDYMKTAGSDIEIGVENLDASRTSRISRISAVINYIPAETLSVDLKVATDESSWSDSLFGSDPLNDVDLQATVSGTAAGTINYSFWWNCSDATTIFDTARSICGDPDGTIGNENGIKFDGITTNPKEVPDAYDYTPAGTYTAKVIAERGASSTEDRATITVNAQTLDVDLTAALDESTWSQSLDCTAPCSGIDLSAAVSGTAIGTINYTFYCDRADTGTGIPTPPNPPYDPPKYDGVTDNPQGSPDHCSHLDPGTYYLKVIVERGLAPADQDQVVVTVVPNSPPTVTSIDKTYDWADCSTCTTIFWTYTDPDDDPPGTDPQSQYQVQVDNDDNFLSVFIDSCISPPAPSSTCTPGNDSSSYMVSGLSYDMTYHARVKVWDSGSNESLWSSSVMWTTPHHAYPDAWFTYEPLQVELDEEVQFTDATTFHDGLSSGDPSHLFAWTFVPCMGDPPECDVESSALQNPTNTFHVIQQTLGYEATLMVTDSWGYADAVARIIPVGPPLPKWREIMPR